MRKGKNNSLGLFRDKYGINIFFTCKVSLIDTISKSKIAREYNVTIHCYIFLNDTCKLLYVQMPFLHRG